MNLEILYKKAKKTNDYYFDNFLLLTDYFNEKDKGGKARVEVIQKITTTYLIKNKLLFILSNGDSMQCIDCNVEILSDSIDSVCIECGRIYCQAFVPVISDTGQINQKPNVYYVKKNHFLKVINEFNGINTMSVPSIVFDKIRLVCTKNNVCVDRLDEITLDRILVNNGLKKFRKQKKFILSRLGIEIKTINVETVERLMNLFSAIQIPYNILKPVGRSNFFNYSFVLFHFLIYLENNEPIVVMEKDKKNHELLQKCLQSLNK